LPTNSGSNIIFNPVTGYWSKASTLGYETENMISLLKDIAFLLAKDTINKQLIGYNDILPTSGFSLRTKDKTSHILYFSKPDSTI